MTDTGLSEAEWGVVERLSECHSLMVELPGLEAARFDTGLQELQEQVLALPTKRAMAAKDRKDLPARCTGGPAAMAVGDGPIRCDQHYKRTDNLTARQREQIDEHEEDR